MKPISFRCEETLPFASEDIGRQILDLTKWPDFDGYWPIPGIKVAEFDVLTPGIVGTRIRVTNLDDRLAELIHRSGEVVVAPTKTRVLFKVRTVFASVAVTKNWLDLVFVLGRRLKHRRIKKAQEEYPGMVHFLRIEKAEDLNDDLASWLQEAYDHRTQKHGEK